jgi:hypothetical protein
MVRSDGRRSVPGWTVLVTAAAYIVATLLLAPAALAQIGGLPALGQTVTNLFHAGETANAIPLAERALAIRKKALPVDHPDIARNLQTVAALYKVQGRYTEAEPLYQSALAITRPRRSRTSRARLGTTRWKGMPAPTCSPAAPASTRCPTGMPPPG